MPIAIEMNPAAEVLRALSTGIVDCNRSTISDLEPVEAEVRFHVIATDDGEKLIGGVRAACYWKTLNIELLWLSETARGQGSGRQVIGKAEDFARELGCENALVETTSWQAKPFYEKNGYVLMGTLKGRPKGHASHYVTKSLM